jgi:mannosyltransferase
MLLVTALALGLRLYRLAAQSLSYDEAVSAYLAQMPVLEMLRWTAADVQPPLYYLLLRLWTVLAGTSEYSLRFLSLGLSLLVVPLVFRLALQLTPGGQSRRWARAAAGIAALAAAIHPWYVWHAQDARMYSLLLAAGALSTLLLLRWPGSSTRRGTAIALALSYIALLYTHYLSLGLLAGHALLVAWWAWRRRDRRLLGAYAGRVLVPASLAFLPWLPAALRTMSTDASYWSGALKADEAIRKTIIAAFVGAPGETVIETAGLSLATAMAVALVLALLVSRPRPALPVLALAAAAAAVTGLAFLLTPKFNPRYLILASLALPLLWGQAVAYASRRLVGLVALAVLVGGSAAGLAGMYWDVRLTRADFRSAIAHVQAARQSDEPVLLVSGHMYPVWRYYAPSTPYVPLPDLRVLSVDAALDMSVAPALEKALAGAPGAWVLLWQDEVTDPMGAVTFLLDQAGEPEEQRFWHVRTRHYRLDPEATIAAPGTPATTCQFRGGLRFLGAVPDSGGGIALLWQTDQPLPQELRVQVSVSDEAGHLLLSDHLAPGGDSYPTTLWRPGQTAFVRYHPDAPAGTPAGTYRASLAVYDAASGAALEVLDAAGNPAGQLCPIGEVELEGNTQGLDPAAVAAQHGLQPTEGAWAGIQLVAAGSLPAESLVPGAAISLPLLWQAALPVPNAPAEYELEVSLLYPDGSTRSQRQPLSSGYPPGRWEPGEVILSWLDWTIPADAPAGPAALQVALWGEAGPAGEPLTLGSLEVAAVARSYALPSPRYPSEAVAGGTIRLLGLDADREEAQPGSRMAVTLHFQALETPTESYTLFLHLVGEDGRVWSGVNAEPEGRPTAGWLPGEVITLEYELAVPEGTPPGSYTYEVGWFLPEEPGMPRLEMSEGDRELPSRAATLGELYVR